jgi:dTDP-4-dehydrorhamnose 3,5-epimerase
MQFEKTPLEGACIINLTQLQDERGFFARSFCEDTLKNLGIEFPIVQCNISYNKKRGTLRGMHYQMYPHTEGKIVRCTSGAIYDVILDLRPGSPTYEKWYGVHLSKDNYKMLYIPPGFAHGFQTLLDDTEVFYHMSSRYVNEAARGILWNDPAFKISWPLEVTVISGKDRQYPLWNTTM